MGLKELFIPDYYFNDISQITPDFLHSLGVRAIISDIDNTLVTYDDAEPTGSLCKWIDSMTDAGIRIAFISNNKEERVRRFNKKLGFFYVSDSGKPSRRSVSAALKHLEASPSEACVLGDQIFTDVLSAKRSGVKAILVKPIKDKKNLFVRFKRLCEKPFLRSYGNSRKIEKQSNETHKNTDNCK